MFALVASFNVLPKWVIGQGKMQNAKCKMQNARQNARILGEKAVIFMGLM